MHQISHIALKLLLCLSVAFSSPLGSDQLKDFSFNNSLATGAYSRSPSPYNNYSPPSKPSQGCGLYNGVGDLGATKSACIDPSYSKHVRFFDQTAGKAFYIPIKSLYSSLVESNLVSSGSAAVGDKASSSNKSASIAGLKTIDVTENDTKQMKSDVTSFMQTNSCVLALPAVSELNSPRCVMEETENKLSLASGSSLSTNQYKLSCNKGDDDNKIMINLVPIKPTEIETTTKTSTSTSTHVITSSMFTSTSTTTHTETIVSNVFSTSTDVSSVIITFTSTTTIPSTSTTTLTVQKVTTSTSVEISTSTDVITKTSFETTTETERTTSTILETSTDSETDTIEHTETVTVEQTSTVISTTPVLITSSIIQISSQFTTKTNYVTSFNTLSTTLTHTETKQETTTVTLKTYLSEKLQPTYTHISEAYQNSSDPGKPTGYQQRYVY